MLVGPAWPSPRRGALRLPGVQCLSGSPSPTLLTLQPWCGCSQPWDSAPGKQLPAGPWSRRGRGGCSPGRGTPQCLLSNHLLPPCQEPSAHKQRRAPVRSACLRDKPGQGKHIHLRVSWPETEFRLLAFSWRRLRARHNSPEEPDTGEPAPIPGERCQPQPVRMATAARSCCLRPCWHMAKGPEPGLSPCGSLDMATSRQELGSSPEQKGETPCPASLRPAVPPAPSRAQVKSFQPGRSRNNQSLGDTETEHESRAEI